ncbi:MAG: CYTH domain-containing protein [Bacteroidales bacterium]|nr:CYTH domain-containing protein [Bacteroidales bacterium]
MAQEIERKFLVTGDFKSLATKSIRILQGYLSSNPERTVRVRIKGDSGFITIKGIVNASGTSRYEWEKEIPVEEADELLTLCEPGIIDKTRFLIPETSGLTFEVDEFYGDNQGLIVAEIELPSEDTSFEKPSWLGEEVTGDARYFNSSLIKNPFQNQKTR